MASLHDANEDGDVTFPNDSPTDAIGHHCDHEGGKENKAAGLRKKQVPVLLNECGRYLSRLCAPCHGVKTWLDQHKNESNGRVFVPSQELLAQVTTLN